MSGYQFIPGVRVGGHVARNGYWHPGSADSCPKDPCHQDRARDQRPQRVRGSDGNLHIPSRTFGLGMCGAEAFPGRYGLSTDPRICPLCTDLYHERPELARR